jgi:hypothetical protein
MRARQSAMIILGAAALGSFLSGCGQAQQKPPVSQSDIEQLLTAEVPSNSKSSGKSLGYEEQMVTYDYDYALPEQFDQNKIGLLADKIVGLARSKEKDWQGASSEDHGKISERTLESSGHIIIVSVILLDRDTPLNRIRPAKPV